jgi:hypothetical protein
MTTLEIILSILLYAIGAIFTGVKDDKTKWSAGGAVIIGIFFPLVWFVIILKALFWTDWDDL